MIRDTGRNVWSLQTENPDKNIAVSPPTPQILRTVSTKRKKRQTGPDNIIITERDERKEKKKLVLSCILGFLADTGVELGKLVGDGALHEDFIDVAHQFGWEVDLLGRVC
jgi:hypothetical protein